MNGPPGRHIPRRHRIFTLRVNNGENLGSFRKNVRIGSRRVHRQDNLSYLDELSHIVTLGNCQSIGTLKFRGLRPWLIQSSGWLLIDRGQQCDQLVAQLQSHFLGHWRVKAHL